VSDDRSGVPGRVVVLGALNVDLVVRTERLPGPGETVVGSDLVRHGGGKGANAAVAAARIGAQVSFIGAVGDDETGTAALADLRAEGISTEGVKVIEGVSTGTALIIVDATGENQIAVSPGANAHLTVPLVLAALEVALADAECLLVSTEIPVETVNAAVHRAVSSGIRCVLNPAPVSAELLSIIGAGVVLTPNAGELLDLVALLPKVHHQDENPKDDDPQDDDDQDSLDASAAAVAQATGAQVVVTVGKDGALLAEPGAALHRVPSVPVEAVDATGAGDTFNGVLAARLAVGDPLPEAVATGTLAASLSVRQRGARSGMPTLADTRRHGAHNVPS